MSRLVRQLALLALAAGLVAAPRPGGASEPDEFAALVTPFLEQHCLQCHSGGDPSGGFSLDGWTDARAALRQPDAAETVLARLASGEMPPEDEPQPEAATKQQVMDWLSRAIENFDCNAAPDPGRVTIRRLNRDEYKNTVRDLLGVEFDPTADFPADDMGYGYDTIGDVLSTSPLLVERYWEAAQELAQRVIVVPESFSSPSTKYPPEQFAGGKHRSELGRVLSSTGMFATTVAFPQAGKYLLKIRAFGDQAGPEPARMRVMWDDRELATFDVAASRGAPRTYLVQLAAEAGEHRLELHFINDYYDEEHPDPEQRDRNLWMQQVEVQGPVDGELANLPATHRRIIGSDASYPPTPEQTRAMTRRFLARAYRRPARDEDVRRLVALVDAAQRGGQSFESGMRLVVQAALVSPHFLFRGEPQESPDDPKAIAPLDDYALASRLSYFLWSSMPDEALFAAAAEESLRRDLAAHVQRMLADPKADALVKNFAGQWLQTRKLADVTPDPKQFPHFDAELRAAMQQETELFFAAVLREDRSIFDFLSARYTFLNERLARHYGIAGIQGKDFRRVELSTEQRGGVLTHASVLTLTSHPNRTSPVKRGAWILEQILGDGPPPPPPNVPELQEPREGVTATTLRKQLEQHRSQAGCMACHRRIDPLGFALENYDAIGAWRETESGAAVDASAQLADGRQFEGIAGLRQVLLDEPDQFRTALTEQMLVYALGRGLERYDRCAVEEITAKLAAHDDRLSQLILAIVESDPFLMRRGDGGDR